jgi:hypothetical protein
VTAAALAPALAWALAAPVLLVPVELRLSGIAHRALLDERARLVGASDLT